MARREIEGPAQFWSEDLPPSRGQIRDIAILSMRLLGLEIPKTRLAATIMMVRLRKALTETPPDVKVPGALD